MNKEKADNGGIQPPRLAQRILLSFLRDDIGEEVLGDLDEKFNVAFKKHNAFRAKLNYWYQVLNYLRPFAIKNLRHRHLLRYAMFKNYFKIGSRHLLKNKGYTAINLGGLAVGMAVAMLIGLWIYDELSFNEYHHHYDRIAQVMKGGSWEGKTYKGQRSLPYPLLEVLQTNYHNHFELIVPARQPHEYILTAAGKKITRNGEFMGAGAPEMFTFNMVHGTWSGLTEMNSVMLSASTAKALFGNADPVNKEVLINTDMLVKVNGVYEDFPHNSQLHGLHFISTWDLCVTREPWIKEQAWDNHFIHIYVLIRPNTTFDQIDASIRDAEMKVIRNMESMKGEMAYNPQVMLHPMHNWHLYSNFKDGSPEQGPVRFVWLVGIIGGFVLVLACINFMNLSTARSEKRAKEVGIRKTIGSVRSQLINQFFSESFIVIILAFVLSVFLVNLGLPWFNAMAEKRMSIPWTSLEFWLCSVVFIFITGILAGSYPALYLSSFSPVRVLKGTLRSGRLASLPRKVLVVLQFTVSVTLIICTIMVYKQIMFAKHRPVGYTREGLLMIQKKSDDFYGKTEALRNELKRTGVVYEVAESGGQITTVWSGNNGFEWKGKDPDIEAQFATLGVSSEYGQTVGWKFVDGRDFSGAVASDSSGFIINESAAKYMGMTAPVGEILHWKNKWHSVDKDFKILGVVKDMVMASPFEPTQPTVFFLPRGNGWINIKIDPNISTSKALAEIETVFKKVIPSAPFDYKFADEEYALKFAVEERIGKLASVFAVLAVFISCLGLFGLASFVAEQRTKEIGIRKVVGASVFNLWKLLSKDFVVLIIIACFIAVPIAYYSLLSWLQNYAYRTPLSGWVFLLSVLGAIVITLMTVSYQAIKAALMNPMKSLRSE